MNWTTSNSTDRSPAGEPMRRRSMRFPMDMPAMVTPQGGLSEPPVEAGLADAYSSEPYPCTGAHTRDISADGAFVCLVAGPPVGTRLNVEMLTAVHQRIGAGSRSSLLRLEAPAIVVRRTAEGVALEFEISPSIRRMAVLD